ncbi:MAG: hypothetical protein JWO56_1981, partial [Acidobacteria bacterium]|nr:hypothetical protein [Acidobacteriota bacterium]
NLVHTLNETLEIDLKPSELLDYSTVDRLTEYIAERWAEPVAAKLGNAPQAAVASEGAPRPSGSDACETGVEPLATVGMHDSAMPAGSKLPIAAQPASLPATGEEILESVLWQDALADDYEKVTF